jgi:uncharacterized membrane protein
MNIVQILLIVFTPLLILRAEKKLKFIETLGAVVCCYILGIVYGNILPINVSVSNSIVEAVVPLSIPMLLFATNFKKWITQSKSTIYSFLFVIISVCIASILSNMIFKDKVEDYWKIASMLIGVYTGGTANLTAIGKSIGVKNETFLLVNSADLILGGAYYFLILSILPKILGKFLRPYENPTPYKGIDCNVKVTYNFLNFIKSLLISGACVGAAVGLSIFVKGTMDITIIMLTLTTFGILFSFNSRVHNIKESTIFGNYLLLVFCVGIGSMANVRTMDFGAVHVFIAFAFVMGVSGLIHFLLCFIFKIDRDTALITAVAGVFGPPFVGAVAKRLDNSEILIGGLTSGVVGYAVGNYLGIGISMLLK